MSKKQKEKKKTEEDTDNYTPVAHPHIKITRINKIDI
jgi:hypothetical protein